ncbi:MAG: hypothetical protein HOC23_13245 [Halieaceae bacterium]|jgi:uncharacterized membrane protein affecting hemolysin expression|nr:hypothetical protein [Halieaceae bacterium]
MGNKTAPEVKNLISRVSLGQQLALIAAGLSLIIGLALVALGATSSSHMQQTLQAEYGTALAHQIAGRVSTAMESGDLLIVSASLQRFVNSSTAEQVTVYDLEGKALGQAGESRGQNLRQYTAPVQIDSDTAGQVVVTMNLDREVAAQQRFVFSLLGLAILLSLAAYGFCRRLAQQLADRLIELANAVALDHGEDFQAGARQPTNEIDFLTHRIRALPMNLLRTRDSRSADEDNYQTTAVIYMHLTSMVSYVDTLDQRTLHRYTDRLHQVIYNAAGFYAGELYVTRQFGLAINFNGHNNSGSAAFRAASCAWLIQTALRHLESKLPLSMSVAMAISQSELGAGDASDIYPGLYMQHTIDELQAICASQPPKVLLSPAICEDLDVAHRLEHHSTELDNYAILEGFAEPYRDLLERQFRLIEQRIAESLAH